MSVSLAAPSFSPHTTLRSAHGTVASYTVTMAGLRIAARALSRRLTSASAAPAYAGAGAVRGLADAAQANAPQGSPPLGAPLSEAGGD